MSTREGFEQVPASATGESFTGYRLARALDERGGVPAGTVIADKYRVERVLGEGAMGVVVAARHLELDELVAIKCIRAAMPWSPDVDRALRPRGESRPRASRASTSPG